MFTFKDKQNKEMVNNEISRQRRRFGCVQTKSFRVNLGGHRASHDSWWELRDLSGWSWHSHNSILHSTRNNICHEYCIVLNASSVELADFHVLDGSQIKFSLCVTIYGQKTRQLTDSHQKISMVKTKPPNRASTLLARSKKR